MIPLHLRTEDLRWCREQSPEAIVKMFRDIYGIVLQPPSPHNDLEARTRNLAYDLFSGALEAGWRTTEAASLITPNVMVPLLLPDNAFSWGDCLVRQSIHGKEGDSTGVSAFESLREDVLLAQNGKRMMNWEEAARLGYAADFSYVDTRRGIRLPNPTPENLARLAYLQGVLWAKGAVDNAQGHVIGISVSDREHAYLDEVLQPLLYGLFHYTLTQAKRPLIASKAVYTNLRDDWQMIREDPTRDVLLAESTRYEEAVFLDRYGDRFLEVYTAGLLAAKGVSRHKKRHLPRIEFNDLERRTLQELKWAIETLGERWPAGDLKGGKKHPHLRHLNAGQVLALGEAPGAHFIRGQKGYLTSPSHLALLPELKEAVKHPDAHSSLRMYGPSRS